jgi:hypothetical protein
MIELTKSQKQKVRELIERGLMKDYLDGVQRMKKITDSFVEGKSDPKEVYHKLAHAFLEKDKVIATRYDDLRGSNYVVRLAMLLGAGVISKEELLGLDDELRAKLIFLSERTV